MSQIDRTELDFELVEPRKTSNMRRRERRPMHKISHKLAELGHCLPEAEAPVANYVSTTRADRLLIVAGQISAPQASPVIAGRLGESLTAEEGREAAVAAGLNLLAQLAAATDGTIEAISRVLQLCVFINAAPQFTEHSTVANGASDLLTAVFGEAGRHARTAIGVASLPAGAAVEIDAIIELRP